MSERDNFKTFVVVNPNSSGGKTGRRFPALKQSIERRLGAEVGYALTRSPLDATRRAREALESGYEMIVSVGGDGTHNEILNGFFTPDGKPVREDAVLGVIPSGTGGDFRRTAYPGESEEQMLDRLVGRNARPIDVGRSEFTNAEGAPVRRMFLNITSFGIGGAVSNYVNESTKAFGGRVSFFIGAFRGMLAYHNQRLRLSIDEEEPREIKINNIAVANGRFFGGGMKVAPRAELDDGLFDVVTFGDLSKLEYAMLSRFIYSGTHLERPKVSFTRARRVVAESDEVVLIDMDGEQPGRLPLTLEVVPRALRLKTTSTP